ncbi:MAG: hypothetical protein M1370_02605 [Bacteroidetes bacterium]|nr:hypothetical protein [Bacteroidota bacterium]
MGTGVAEEAGVGDGLATTDGTGTDGDGAAAPGGEVSRGLLGTPQAVSSAARAMLTPRISILKAPLKGR